ncbi:sulfurtransferase [uncultured Shewanella sp.]|uniref:sulfurtransferase n=1 Tax=uncultured Shewanella sp. TaxID=173975 RepID=UPI0026312137|nr:sulfurtransferase [uncultured Shewanella sp.]
MLITALALNQLIESQHPHLHIFDCRYALPQPQEALKETYGQQAYFKGHIPHAQFVDIDAQLTGEITTTSGRHPLPTHANFNQQLQLWGLDNNSKIVIYADTGNLFATRLWWMLHRWANIADVALLDGGFNAWQNAGLPITSALPQITPSNHCFMFDDSQYVDMQYVQNKVIQKKQKFITDARTTSRFNGEPNPIDTVLGHIPGAVNLPCQNNIDEAGYFLSKEQLKTYFSPLAQHNAPEPVIHSCGSGLTACHNAFAMELVGLPHYKLYIGSWSEWSKNKHNLIEK